MKRSEINQIIAESIEFFEKYRFKLPKFGYYKLDDWKNVRESNQEVFDLGLGWDITDFGMNKFNDYGLVLFTLRNGMLNSKKYTKSYAEKIMVGKKDQITPMHYHVNKTEDIINRGGGKFAIQVYLSDEKDEKTDRDVILSFDGTCRTLKAGSWVYLEPGQSITLTPYVYHSFHAEGDDVLIGEVSAVNDDNKDNFFYGGIGRFPDIEEDVDPVYLLVNDYPKFLY